MAQPPLRVGASASVGVKTVPRVCVCVSAYHLPVFLRSHFLFRVTVGYDFSALSLRLKKRKAGERGERMRRRNEEQGVNYHLFPFLPSKGRSKLLLAFPPYTPLSNTPRPSPAPIRPVHLSSLLLLYWKSTYSSVNTCIHRKPNDVRTHTHTHTPITVIWRLHTLCKTQRLFYSTVFILFG